MAPLHVHVDAFPFFMFCLLVSWYSVGLELAGEYAWIGLALARHTNVMSNAYI
jgi:hypothetical protein